MGTSDSSLLAQQDTKALLGPLEGIQVLRFFAAFLVMVTHATFFVGARIDPEFPVWNDGAQGVAIFFVISGLVMTLSSKKLYGTAHGCQKFLIHRFVRIVPLYWAVNIIKLFGLFFVPSAIVANPDMVNVFLSLLFIPSRNASGAIETFYGVGWTLNFEMFFYVLFALALLLRIKPLYFVAPILSVSVALSSVRDLDWPALTVLFNPIVINFIWGMLIGECCLNGCRLRVIPALLLFLYGLILLFIPLPDFLSGFAASGLTYAALVAGTVFLEPVIRGRIPRLLIFMGDASYSLYLIHPLVGVMVAMVLAKLNMKSSGLAISTICLVCCLVAALSYSLFEFPVTRYFKRRFL